MYMYLVLSRFPLTSKEFKSYPPLCQEQFSQLDFQGEARCEEVISTDLDLNPGVATDPICELGQITHNLLFVFFLFLFFFYVLSENDNTFLPGFWGRVNEEMIMIHLSLTHSKCTVMVSY